MTQTQQTPVMLARLLALQAAHTAGRITEHSEKTMIDWLTQPQYREFSDTLAERIDQELWKELDDAFWTVIPFGTGGRRGTMYPVGSNAINDRTIGESAQDLPTMCKACSPLVSRLLVQLLTILGIVRNILQNSARKCCWQPASRFSFCVASAAHQSFRLQYVQRQAPAALW